jgi:hypothetical protein
MEMTNSEAGYGFVWRRPNAFLDHFMLKANDESYAYFRFLDQDKLLAELEVDLEQLVFVDNGSSRPVIEIYYAGSDQGAKPILSYESHLQGTGGYFWLSNGCRLGWQPSRRMREWTQRTRMHERPSARPPASPRSGLGCKNSGWHASYALLDQDGTRLVRFGTNGTMVCMLQETRAWTTWTELLAILALGWLLIRMDIDSCKRYAI